MVVRRVVQLVVWGVVMCSAVALDGYWYYGGAVKFKDKQGREKEVLCLGDAHEKEPKEKHIHDIRGAFEEVLNGNKQPIDVFYEGDKGLRERCEREGVADYSFSELWECFQKNKERWDIRPHDIEIRRVVNALSEMFFRIIYMINVGKEAKKEELRESDVQYLKAHGLPTTPEGINKRFAELGEKGMREWLMSLAEHKILCHPKLMGLDELKNSVDVRVDRKLGDITYGDLDRELNELHVQAKRVFEAYPELCLNILEFLGADYLRVWSEDTGNDALEKSTLEGFVQGAIAYWQKALRLHEITGSEKVFDIVIETYIGEKLRGPHKEYFPDDPALSRDKNCVLPYFGFGLLHSLYVQLFDINLLWRISQSDASRIVCITGSAHTHNLLKMLRYIGGQNLFQEQKCLGERIEGYLDGRRKGLPFRKEVLVALLRFQEPRSVAPEIPQACDKEASEGTNGEIVFPA